MVIGILDYGAGNLKSVCRAINHLNGTSLLITSPEQLTLVDKLILPGVGAFKVAMDKIDQIGLLDGVKEFADRGKPVMGICLGMQLLFEKSYEFGSTVGLGLIPGEIGLIDRVGVNGVEHKIPHIGWNELIVKDEDLYLFDSIGSGDAVYFVHSYMAFPSQGGYIAAYVDYDGIEIPAVVKKGNIVGCQFHPEKSGNVGLKILSDFIEN